ncbi:lysylphosphatidylglycerol synthase domain-containing protein [Algimonas porphyrae]|uniref:Flippase-like domain-containing protein n=1 Tax=Algimonas porphyrae TaxID=1128113 RepID=A0ABQ5V382_9PROT|nr:lysylphosphatidylglycerol synthase transmembrane domain-containing protein [Algimonas porphyrae]GLQ21961.1 hypothetical protein GCM10007854_29160 [Algimonas porphyrae]
MTSVTRQRLTSIIGFVVLIGLIGWYFGDAERRAGVVTNIASVGWGPFGVMVVGMFAFILFQAFVLIHSLTPFGKRVGFWEAFGIIVVTFFTNYLIPFLGFGIRGVYLKKKHDLSYADFSQSLIAILIVEWAIFASLALIAMAVLFASGHVVSPFILILMAGIVTGFFVLMAARPSWVPGFLPLSGFAKTVVGDWRQYSSHRGALLRVAFYTLLEAIGFILAFVIAYKTLFPAVPAAASVVAGALSDLALIIRILPASAGSLEGALHLSMLEYNLSFEDNLSVALVTRAALAVIFVPLGPVFLWWLLTRSKAADAGEETVDHQ